jgi:hypothetical protein
MRDYFLSIRVFIKRKGLSSTRMNRSKQQLRLPNSLRSLILKRIRKSNFFKEEISTCQNRAQVRVKYDLGVHVLACYVDVCVSLTNTTVVILNIFVC